MPRILTRKRRPLDGGPMPYDEEHQPVKRKRATPECDPPGIAGRVCDGRKFGGAEQEAPLSTLPFGAFPHASKNSWCGARRTLANASDPKLHFTLNHYMFWRHRAGFSKLLLKLEEITKVPSASIPAPNPREIAA